LNKISHWIILLIGITPIYLMYIEMTQKEPNKEVEFFYKKYFKKNMETKNKIYYLYKVELEQNQEYNISAYVCYYSNGWEKTTKTFLPGADIPSRIFDND